MTTSVGRPGERVKDVRCTDDLLVVDLIDGSTISVPLAWYPRLLRASSEQRANWPVSAGGFGIHWLDVDEDLSTEGLLRGAPAPRGSTHVRGCGSATSETSTAADPRARPRWLVWKSGRRERRTAS